MKSRKPKAELVTMHVQVARCPSLCYGITEHQAPALDMWYPPLRSCDSSALIFTEQEEDGNQQ